MLIQDEEEIILVVNILNRKEVVDERRTGRRLEEERLAENKKVQRALGYSASPFLFYLYANLY